MSRHGSSISAGQAGRRVFCIAGGLVLAVSILSAGIALAAAATGVSSGPVPASQPVEVAPRWLDLSVNQRNLISPLEREWPRLDARSKQKWLAVAARLPTVGPAERERIQARMTHWASLSPLQRSQMRLRYQEARQVEPKSRQDRWAAYQALPSEERERLAASGSHAARLASAASGSDRNRSRSAAGSVVTRKVVAPSVVQAQPGATTSLISRKTAPPAHVQPGMPRLMASPSLVDSVTLLPRKAASATPPPARPDMPARP